MHFSPLCFLHGKMFVSPEVFFYHIVSWILKVPSDSRRRNFFTWPLWASIEHRTHSDVVHHIFSLFTCFSNSRWAFWMLIIDKTKHDHLLKRERWRWAIRAWGGIYWPASGDNMWHNMLIEENILIDYWSAFKL